MGAKASTQNKTEKEDDSKSADSKGKKTEDHVRYARWGLGLGIDITKPRPWLQKSSFQVREISKTMENIIETDHGGFLQVCKEEIHSTATKHAEIKAGVKIPDLPLNLGVGAEYTRSTISSKSIRGTKIKNRTISFRMGFDDVPQPLPEKESCCTEQRDSTSSATEQDTQLNSTQDVKKKTVVQEKEAVLETIAKKGDTPEPDDSSKPMASKPFEKRLYKWLNDCHKSRNGDHMSQTMSLQDMIRNEDNRIKKDITHFVQCVGVTHYVSAIQLGAHVYGGVTEKERNKGTKAGANVSLTALNHGSIETSGSLAVTKKWTQKKSEQIKLGRITKDKDKKKHVTEENEAVIACEVVPIATLVKDPYLHEALKTSVEKYIESQAKSMLIIATL